MLQVVQIEILRLLFLLLIGRCRGGRQVLRVTRSRLLLNEVGVERVLAVRAAAAAAAGVWLNGMAVLLVAVQLLPGVLRGEGRRGIRQVLAPAPLAVPRAAAAAVGKVCPVRVECRRRRHWGRHLEKW